MDEKNESNYTKETILIILLLFMFSNKLLDFAWDIGKSLLYLIILINCINYLNPILGTKIREITNDFINIDPTNGYMMNSLSKISTYILDLIKKPVKNLTSLLKIEETSNNNIALKSEEDVVREINSFRLEKNRNLSNLEKTNNRSLTN
jgi:hypothetical protein